jgi:hypothetical protein
LPTGVLGAKNCGEKSCFATCRWGSGNCGIDITVVSFPVGGGNKNYSIVIMFVS